MTESEILDGVTRIFGKAIEAKNGTAVSRDGEPLYGFVLDHHDYMAIHCLLNLERVGYSMAEQEALHKRLSLKAASDGDSNG